MINIFSDKKFSLIKDSGFGIRNSQIRNVLEHLTVVNYQNIEKQVPKSKGIYFWVNCKSKNYEYIGIATNNQGLYGRICSKHLNKNYLEYREIKHSKIKDSYQIKNAIRKEANPERKYIDKSAFRKNVGRLMELCPGEDTLDYVRNEGKFYFYNFLNVTNLYLETIETILIAKLQQSKSARV